MKPFFYMMKKIRNKKLKYLKNEKSKYGEKKYFSSFLKDFRCHELSQIWEYVFNVRNVVITLIATDLPG